MPIVKSPVDLFRELLAMDVAERSKALAKRTPEGRKRILAKLREYQSLKGLDDIEIDEFLELH